MRPRRLVEGLVAGFILVFVTLLALALNAPYISQTTAKTKDSSIEDPPKKPSLRQSFDIPEQGREEKSNQRVPTAETAYPTVTIPEGAWEPKGYGFNYFPNQIVVVLALNNTVIWDNRDKVFHTVTARDGSFASGEIDPYGSWRYAFQKPGRYDYYCKFHPTTMTGQVVVYQK